MALPPANPPIAANWPVAMATPAGAKLARVADQPPPAPLAKVVVTYNNGSVPVSAVYLSKALHTYSGSDIGVGISTSDGNITPALMEPTAAVPTPAGVPVGVVVAYSQIS